MATADDDRVSQPIAGTSRARRVELLSRLIRDEAPASHKQQVLLMILWEVPAAIRASLAHEQVSGLLAEFAERHPKLEPMLALLRGAVDAPLSFADIAAWRATLDGNTPTKSELFVFACVADILEATAMAMPEAAATDAAANGVLTAIAAKTAKAWIENDPDAAHDEERLLRSIRAGWPLEQRMTPLRDMSDNPAARSANLQAWADALAIIQSRRLDAYPPIVDRKGLARCVQSARAEAQGWFSRR